MVSVPLRADSVMDPTTLALANVYAEAMLGATPSDEQAETVAAELEAIVGVLNEIDGFEELISPAVLSRNEMSGLISRVFAGRCSGPVEALLGVLVRRGRLHLLRRVVERFRKLLNAREGKIELVVTSAVELGPTERRMIVEELRGPLGAEPILNVRVDESLVGGVKIRIGDRVYDASIAGRLEQMKQALREKIETGT